MLVHEICEYFDTVTVRPDSLYSIFVCMKYFVKSGPLVLHLHSDWILFTSLTNLLHYEKPCFNQTFTLLRINLSSRSVNSWTGLPTPDSEKKSPKRFRNPKSCWSTASACLCSSAFWRFFGTRRTAKNFRRVPAGLGWLSRLSVTPTFSGSELETSSSGVSALS